MSLDYIESRIKEALRLHNGNTTKARQQIIAWTYEDVKLLHALAKPHLTGIVAYNIERVASGRSAKKAAPVSQPKKSKASKEDDFGLEILRAVAGNSGAMFGFDGARTTGKPQQASEQHMKALRAMAAKSKSKKK